MELSQGKTFEKPAPGMYLATAVDLVDMPNVQTAYGLKNKIRIHWILAQLNGQPVIGKDGSFVEAVGIWTANMGAKAELPKRLTQILGQAPPVLTSSEQLEQLVIGRSNILVLVANPNPAKPNDPFINVDSIAPVPPGMVPPVIPPTYVRFKNRPRTQAGPNGQPVQTYAAPQPVQPTAQAAYVPPAAPPAQQQPYQQPAYPQPPQNGYPNPGAPAQPTQVDLNAGAPAPSPNRPF